MLKALGRIHDADEARRAIEAALAAFDNVNLDLMYALPGQTLAKARADLDAGARAAARRTCRPTTSRIEPNTLFCSKPPPLPDDDAAADMQSMRRGRCCAQRASSTTRSRPSRRPGQRCRAQPQLLGVRRLPRHRRRRARQAQLPRPHRAPGARQAAARVPGKATRGRVEKRVIAAARAAVRVHAERAAPDRGLPAGAVRGAHRPAARRDRERSWTRRSSRACSSATGSASGPTERGPALPQRPAGAVPRRRNTRSRTGWPRSPAARLELRDRPRGEAALGFLEQRLAENTACICSA